jgi:hypothetical protein
LRNAELQITFKIRHFKQAISLINDNKIRI